MDFPKSVPSVGLVDGKFVDEDPLGGAPGSLIPSAWGNAVTLEILHVIESAGLVPDESNLTQLTGSISALAASARPLASQAEAEAGVDNAKAMTPLRVVQSITKRFATQVESETGTDNSKLLTPLRWAQAFIKRLATQAQVDAGTDDATFLSPAKARNGFSATLNAVGWIRLPTWLGGVTLSWHNSTVTSAGVTTSLPIAAATGFLGAWACHQGPKGVAAYSCSVSVSDAVKNTIDVTSSVAGAANFKVFVLSW